MGSGDQPLEQVLRTWGFNAINATELAGAHNSNLTYYQVRVRVGVHRSYSPLIGLEQQRMDAEHGPAGSAAARQRNRDCGPVRH
jgi:hypothetical protein